MTLSPTIICAGLGSEELRLGQLSERTREVLGQPDEVKLGEGKRAYWIFRRKGTDCLISVRTQRLLSLFFLREGCDGHRGASVVSPNGIGLGDTEGSVLEVFGHPKRQGGAFVMTSGDYVRKWYSYDSGIGFHFGADNAVDYDLNLCSEAIEPAR